MINRNNVDLEKFTDYFDLSFSFLDKTLLVT